MIQFPALALVVILSIIPQRTLLADAIQRYKDIIKKTLTIIACAFPLMMFFPKTENTIGEIALALLWLNIWLPIFSKVFDFIVAKRLSLFRRELGILMGVMALIHFLQYFFKKKAVSMLNPKFWYDDNTLTYMAIGFAALVIASAMALTSNDYSMRLLKKNWKLLHKWVYALIILAVLHVIVYNINKHYKHLDRPFSYVQLYLLTILPAALYFIGKIMEWKKAKIALLPKSLNNK